MITLNKGEWSEFYVFLKLLGDGILYAADSNLNKIDNLFYPLVEIIRKENENIKHYKKQDLKINVIGSDGNIIATIPITKFREKADILLDTLKKSNKTFSVPEIESFMNYINCQKVKADSLDKSDITLVLHDCNTYRNETFGFSIKSKLGSPSTLLNSGKSTNFIYKIQGNLSNDKIIEINNINTKSKIRDRLKKLQDFDYTLNYTKMENDNFKANLQMIDCSFPLIMSEYLIQYYLGNESLISELTSKVRSINPCNLDISLPHLYYEHKIKTFLIDIALGMTPASIWNGNYQATGGYIIVKENGEVLCYHIYNHNEFKEYLFKNTKFDTPSTSRYDFGTIYKENGSNYIKLNLQIRFI